jgi:hypothetical protein
VNLALRLLTVFGIGAVDLWAAFPAGLALGLSPLVIGAVAAAGALAGLIVIVYPGERLRAWLVARDSRQGKNRSMNRAKRLWGRYGVIGVGLIAPLIMGVPAAAALGVAMGAPRQKLVPLLTVVILFWGIVLTILSWLGLAGLHALRK